MDEKLAEFRKRQLRRTAMRVGEKLPEKRKRQLRRGGLAPQQEPEHGFAPSKQKAQHSESASDLDLYVGADDGNRTRTVSLGTGLSCTL
jgi:hypothetical protein